LTLVENSGDRWPRPKRERRECASRRDSVRAGSYRRQLGAVNRGETLPGERRRGEFDPYNPRESLARHAHRRWL